MRRRVVHLVASAATAGLALLGAAWAATGDLPLGGTKPPAPLAISVQATGPLVANDRAGQAILTAEALRPGVPATGEVTIGNAGDAPGAFTLSSGGVADGAGGLSALLDLTVRDVTAAATPVTVYSGKLGAFARVPLGTLAAGAQRRYRFELTYPTGRAAAADNALQGATTSVAFNWDTVAVAAPPAPDAPRPPVPAPPVPAPAVAVPSAPSASSGPSAAPARPAATPTATVPIPATPGAGATRVQLGLGTRRKAVADGRLVTWMTSTTPTRAHVTGTVTVAGRRYDLKATNVSLTARRKTVRLRLPRRAAGSGKRLTVRLTLAAGTGRARITLRRTLRVRTP